MKKEAEQRKKKENIDDIMNIKVSKATKAQIFSIINKN